MASQQSNLQTQTCANCQRSGLQCDGRRPSCSTCMHWQANTSQPVVCTYDAPYGSRPARETAREKKARLEQRIRELEALLSAEREEIREQAQAQTTVTRPANLTTNLPSADVLGPLVTLFFTYVPSSELIVDRNNLLQALRLPRDHPGFPPAHILHAICAVASFFAANVLPGLQTTQNTNSWASQGFQYTTTLAAIAPERYGSSFGEQQAIFAHAAMEAARLPGTLTFEILQANVLLSWFYFTMSYPSRALCATAESLRIFPLLSLTRSDTHQSISPWAATLPLGTSTGQPQVEIERRRCVWWLAYATDRWQNANMPWPSLLDDDDVTQVLPLPLGQITSGVLSSTARQKISTPGVFTSHHPGQTDSFVLYVKGAIVLSLVKTFNLRWDAPYRHLPDGRPDARSTGPFRDIDALLVEFEASVRGFPFLTARGVDQHMFLTRVTPFVATIILHESHARPIDPFCPSTMKMVDSARKIWLLMQELRRANVDISLMDPILSIVLAVACHVFLRVIEVKVSEGRIDEARMFKTEAEVVRGVLSTLSTRFPLALNQGSMLDKFIRDRLDRRYEQIGQSFVTTHLQNIRS